MSDYSMEDLGHCGTPQGPTGTLLSTFNLNTLDLGKRLVAALTGNLYQRSPNLQKKYLKLLKYFLRAFKKSFKFREALEPLRSHLKIYKCF